MQPTGRNLLQSMQDAVHTTALLAVCVMTFVLGFRVKS